MLSPLIGAVLFLVGSPVASADDGDRSPSDAVTVAGSVVLRDPVELPPGTLLTVTLEDVSRAQLTVGDQLLFTTTERNQVDVLNPSPLELVLDPVPATEPPPAPSVTLTDSYWKLIEVDGRPIQAADQAREPHLILNAQDSRFASSGGVNRLMGGYTLDGDSLSFSQVASTMMAGPPEAMQQEHAITAALGQVRTFRLTAERLTLLDASGTPVLRATLSG